MKKLKFKTYTYEFDNNFYIDIVKSPDDVYESWIYLKDYGFKMSMFGCFANSLEGFIDLVIANIPEYINLYIETKNDMEEYYIEKDL